MDSGGVPMDWLPQGSVSLGVWSQVILFKQMISEENYLVDFQFFSCFQIYWQSYLDVVLETYCPPLQGTLLSHLRAGHKLPLE